MNILHTLFFVSLTYCSSYAMQHDGILSKGILEGPVGVIETYGRTTNAIRMWVSCHTQAKNLYFSGYIYDIFQSDMSVTLYNTKETKALWDALKSEYKKLDDELKN